MARKEKSNVEQMDDEVIKCFIHPNTGREVTTQEERRLVAERWCAGDYDHHRELAKERGLLPVALVIASLIDIDHPLLCSARGVTMNSVEAAIAVTNAMFKKLVVAQPMDNSFHTMHVERTGKVEVIHR